MATILAALRIIIQPPQPIMLQPLLILFHFKMQLASQQLPVLLFLIPKQKLQNWL